MRSDVAVANEPARGNAEAEARESLSELLTRTDRAALLRFMVMMRTAEERGLTLYRQGKVPGSFYDGCGQEAISVGSSFALRPEDRMCILHRDLGAHFVRGVTPDRYLANYMGRADGVTGGKDGNMHFGDPQLGCVGMVSMLPDMAPVACGMAMAFKIRGEKRVAMTYFGEGSTANGQWHEAMNLAGVQRLPVVFMLENNQFAYSTPNELEFAVDPVERAHTYGFPGVTVDGNDVEAVFAASQAAVERARAGEGPTLIECRTMRMHGHGAHDDMSYVPPEMFEEWSQRDPIDLYSKRLVSEHGFSAGRDRRDPHRGVRLHGGVHREGARLPDARPRRRPGRRLRGGLGAARRRPGALVALAGPQRPLGLERGERMTATETTAQRTADRSRSRRDR